MVLKIAYEIKKRELHEQPQPFSDKNWRSYFGEIGALDALLAVIVNLKTEAKVVLVHGGGCVVDEMLAQAGFTTEKKHGLRVTPKEQIGLISGALAGTVNKSIVATASSMNLSAVGLSLADGDMISCTKSELDLGEVGVPMPKSS